MGNVVRTINLLSQNRDLDDAALKGWTTDGRMGIIDTITGAGWSNEIEYTNTDYSNCMGSHKDKMQIQ